MKGENTNPKVHWTIKKQFNACNSQSEEGSLSLNQQLKIFEDKESNLFHKKTEVTSKYLHQNKFMLRTLASKIRYHNNITQK